MLLLSVPVARASSETLATPVRLLVARRALLRAVVWGVWFRAKANGRSQADVDRVRDGTALPSQEELVLSHAPRVHIATRPEQPVVLAHALGLAPRLDAERIDAIGVPRPGMKNVHFSALDVHGDIIEGRVERVVCCQEQGRRS